MAVRKSDNETESQTDREKVERQEAGLEPVDYSDAPKLDKEWFSQAQVCQGDWLVLKVHVDRDVLEFFKSRWPDRVLNTIRQVLLQYMSGKLKVVIPVQEYSADRVKVVGKYDPELVAWIKKKPNMDGFVSLILRDFMRSCIAMEQRGEKVGDSQTR